MSARNIILTLLIIIICAAKSRAQYDEKYRPQYHFSPKKGWIGDPDGLVYFDGNYHLFWWGHATSKDLVHWNEQPYPMKGGSRFSYFSGSMAVDLKNTAGFGDSAMVAVYTMHRGDTIPEGQGLSVSRDRTNFYFYDKSPVLNAPPGKIFFRDPQVFWYGPGNKWVMIVSLANDHKVQLYGSKDLKEWKFLSDFGPLGAQSAFWECPDLYEIPVKNNPGKKKWILVIGQGPDQSQYFTGDFDGTKFTPDKQTVDFLTAGKGVPGTLFQGFDAGDYESWKVNGPAFGSQPLKTDSIRHLGNSLASSWHKKPGDTGSMVSPYFKIRSSAINFLIGGGNHPGSTAINLIVDHKIVRSATGENSKLLKWRGWDVADLAGKIAKLEIVDNYKGKDWDFISVDQIMFSDILWNTNSEHAIWMDYGPDFYAVRSFRNIDTADKRSLMLAWMGNWDYSRDVPGAWGHGFETLPRETSLELSAAGYRMVQQAIPELTKLRSDAIQFNNRVINGIVRVKMPDSLKNTYELQVTFDARFAGPFGLNLLAGDGRKLAITYDPGTSNLLVDRNQCTDYYKNESYKKKFDKLIYAPVQMENHQLKLHIYVDRSSVEIFADDGRTVLTMLTFPGEQQTGIELFANSKVLVNSFTLWRLSSIWKITH